MRTGKTQTPKIKAFEEHIRESTNQIVTVVELFTMKHYQHEYADRLNVCINEKLNEVDFSVICDIQDLFGMTATIIANNPVLCKKMYLDKVDTYAKAHIAVKADKQATTHSKMHTASGTNSDEINFVASYRRNQQAASQAAQPHGGGHSGSNANRGSSFHRGGS
jgi:hypothetical protein